MVKYNIHMENEIMKISPEGLEIAQTYLECKSDASLTAQTLNLPLEEVTRYLNKREVKEYVDRVFYEAGFRNKDRFFGLLDEILAHKLEELEETGLGSSHDILDIMEKYHRMKIKEMELEAKINEKVAPHIQVNQQNNYGGDNYNKLLEKLVGGQH